MELNIYDKYFQLSNPETIEHQFSGNDQSDLLVILPKAGDKMELIKKILSAIKIQDLSTIQILTLKPEDNVSLYPFLKKRKIKKLLSFGTRSERLGLHVAYKVYKPFKFRDIEMIIIDDLELLNQNSNHKKILWNGLKDWI